MIGKCRVVFWLCRVLEEKLNESKKLLTRVGDLSFQMLEFEKMPDEVKKGVVDDLIKDIEHYDAIDDMNWEWSLEELKEEMEKYL